MTDQQKLMDYMFKGVPKEVEHDFLRVYAKWAFSQLEDDRIIASLDMVDWARANKEAFAVLTISPMYREIGVLVIESVREMGRNPQVAKDAMEFRATHKPSWETNKCKNLHVGDVKCEVCT